MTRLHQHYRILLPQLLLLKVELKVEFLHEHLDYVEHYASSWMAYDSNVVAVCPARLR